MVPKYPRFYLLGFYSEPSVPLVLSEPGQNMRSLEPSYGTLLEIGDAGEPDDMEALQWVFPPRAICSCQARRREQVWRMNSADVTPRTTRCLAWHVAGLGGVKLEADFRFLVHEFILEGGFL